MRGIRALLLAACAHTSLFGASPEEWATAVQYCMLLKNSSDAVYYAKSAVYEHPQNEKVYQNLVKTLAESGKTDEAFEAWNIYKSEFQTDSEDLDLIEELAWSVIIRSCDNPSPTTRIVALLGAVSARDMRGRKLMLAALADRCAIVRAAACQLVGGAHAHEYEDKLLILAERDDSWPVRVSALKALSALKSDRAKELLRLKGRNVLLTQEERHAAATALAAWDENETLLHVRSLYKCPEAAFRCFAAELAGYNQCVEAAPLLLELVQDPHHEVSETALQSLTMLIPEWQPDENAIKQVQKLCEVRSCSTSLNAIWLLKLCGNSCADKLFREALHHPNGKIRAEASAVLMVTGRKGLDLAKEMLNTSRDPIVRLNIAAGLIKQRENIEEASNIVVEALNDMNKRWGMLDYGHFSSIVEAKDATPQSLPPELVDIIVRLEWVNLLAIVKDPRVPTILEKFLSARPWGVSCIASMLLLKEGDDSAADAIKQLLENAQTFHLRLQASLVLALWTKDESALSVLQDSYPHAGREVREKIIDAIGYLGSEQSIPFLVEVLQESTPRLRLHAASALLQIIYK